MKDWLGLLKLRITLASTITTGVGYVMARGQVDLPILPVMAGILLQACGAAALERSAWRMRRRGPTSARMMSTLWSTGLPLGRKATSVI